MEMLSEESFPDIKKLEARFQGGIAEETRDVWDEKKKHQMANA